MSMIDDQTPSESDKLSQEQMADLMNIILMKLHKFREAGQKEYAHEDSNAFRNFESVGRNLGLPREKVLLVYLQKHMDGVYAHVKGHTSQRENVGGRILDAMVYLTLLYGMFVADGTIPITDEERKQIYG